MNLSKLKTLLSQCHISNNLLKPFIARAGAEYTLARALEELESVDLSKPKEAEATLIRVIQFANITRYKIHGSIHASSSQGRVGEVDSGSDNKETPATGMGSEIDTR